MELRVVREYYTPGCTIGRLLVDGQFECYTLEDGIRTNKVAGETAIPAGRYPVTINFSNAFRRELPLIDGVRNFTGIRIHSGNTKADTKGCILVGQAWSPGAESIGSSVRAFQALLPKIKAALAAGESVMLSVEQSNAPPELASRELQAVTARRRAKKAGPAKRAGKSARQTAAAKRDGQPRGSKPISKAKTAAKKSRAGSATAKPAHARSKVLKSRVTTRSRRAKASKRRARSG
jgi:hypothetical protein